MGYNFTAVEKKWQKYWLENKTFAALEPADAREMPKAYVLDMFPYPSGAGLHVGHPIGWLGTDIFSRYLRMKGVNVLHPMGWDAFGLPAEQYAVKTNTHPAETTASNIANFRRQIQMLGMSYDWDREVNTTDPSYYKWTQWIFLRLFNSYFDPMDQKAKPITHAITELKNENLLVGPDGSLVVNPNAEGLEAISGEVRIERLWRELSEEEQRDVIDGLRLAYIDEAPVNWCPGLGTVLSNEEIIDGKSEVGEFPVEKRPMRQWMLRITAYADRLLKDLDLLDWPESLKEMQRNWIGRSVGAEVDFEIAMDSKSAGAPNQEDEGLAITVFTTRPDTLYGATYIVLAPEHPLVDQIALPSKRAAIGAYRQQIAGRSDRDRMADAKEKTGVDTGALAINPVNDEKIPIFIADYVMMGYGTGAIMAVPGHDERDFEFATKFGLPIKQVVAPRGTTASATGMPAPPRPSNVPVSSPADIGQDAHGTVKLPYTGEGVAINSSILDGLGTVEAKETIIGVLEAEETGHRSIKYKLRDWLFSRQRYWGEPFPILLDKEGRAIALDDSELPLVLPDMSDFKPTGTPEPPLSKAKEWINVTRDDETYQRETNTMPQWAGSCWYYLRYIDPKNPDRFVDPVKERYWMPVDLYVGGVEHAVLHLLYARFWHKMLFDLGHVSTPEPFARLVNQGLILGEIEYQTAGAEPRKVSEDEIEKEGSGYRLKADPSVKVEAQAFKMSKSRGNVVNPDEIVRDYGADTFRLYEMYMGPLEAQKPWNTRDIVGMSRFLASVHRNLLGDEEDAKRVVTIEPIAIDDQLDRQMQRTIKKVAEDIQALRFNTAIAELIKLNNQITGTTVIPRELAETLVLLLAPFAPHLCEELWERLGHHKSLSRRPWPQFDPAKLMETTIELPVQVNGKVRDRIIVDASADDQTVLAAAQASEKLQPWLAGKSIVKKLYVPKKLVNFVVT
jgi:leucyl-tRNA synthetase